MNSRERVLTALNLKEPDRVPFMELLIDEEIAIKVLGIKKKIEGGHKLDLPPLGNPLMGTFAGSGIYKPYELAEKLNLDGFGYNIQPPTWMEVTGSSNGREFVTNGLIKTRKDLKKLDFVNPEDDQLYNKALNHLKENKKDYAIFACINLGSDPVILSMGLETFFYSMQDDIKLIAELLEIYTDWIAKSVKKICRLGFDFIWACDDLAYKTGPYFSPEIFRKVFLPRLKKVAREISLPWAFHSDGDLMPILEDLLSLGMNALHPIEPGAMDIEKVKKKYGKRICLIGNIDLRYTLTLGTVKETEEEVKQRIREIGPGGGYIVSSANSIPTYVKVENLLAMSNAVLKYGNYPLNF